MKKVIMYLAYPDGHPKAPSAFYEVIEYMKQPSFGIGHKITVTNLINQEDTDYCCTALINDVIHQIGDDNEEESIFVSAVLQFDSGLSICKTIWRKITRTKFELRCYFNQFKKHY